MTPVQEDIEKIYRREAQAVYAGLVHRPGDFDLAEEAVHEAFLAALAQWEQDGVPSNPRAWLISTGRFKAIDKIRRRSRFDASLIEVARRLDESAEAIEAGKNLELEDDRLRLIFTCCHPALAQEARIALTLREVCGLRTEEIAKAFLISTPALAQRIVRAKAKIKDAEIPFAIPPRKDLPQRLDAVLAVIYLVFNEGYSASYGESLTKTDLSEEAIRLGRLLYELLPEGEVAGLLALMLLSESRRSARVTPKGDLILLEDQDRSLWDQAFIAEGLLLINQAFASREVGSYTIQAALSAAHARARHHRDTDWREIVRLYDLLLLAQPSPVIELNRAVAVSMAEGEEAGLKLIEPLLAGEELKQYHLLYAAHGDLCRRLERNDTARSSYQRALELASQEPERRFLRRRLAELPPA